MPLMVVSRDVIHYFKPTIILMIISGLAPVNYRKERNCYVLKQNYLLTIYSYFIGFFLGSSLIFGVWSDTNEPGSRAFRIKVKNDIYIVIADMGAIIACVSFGILVSPWKLKDFFGILTSFDKIHNILNVSTPLLNKHKRKSIISMIIVYCIIIVLILTDIFAWIEDGLNGEKKSSLLYLRYYFSIYFFYLIMMAQELSYCSIMFSVQMSIEALNLQIIETIDSNKIVKQFSGTKKISLENDANVSERNLQKVKNFMNVHEQIFFCVRYINSYFGYILLLILISCLVQLVIWPWFLIADFYGNDQVFLRNVTICWTLFATFRLFLVVEPSHRCLLEFGKTEPLIAQLLRINRDYIVRQELEIFAIQAELYNIQFTSAGVVNIRRSIFASIASAVTTYLVILIQLSHHH